MEHMEVQFDFVEKNGGACVTKILSPGARLCYTRNSFRASGDRAGR